jgi:hypothetical protein
LLGAFTRPAAAARLASRMVPGSITAFGLVAGLLALTRSIVLAMLALTVLGVLWVYILATLNATAQLLAPRWVRGRIMSLYTISFMGLLPLGSILGGAIADVVGPSLAIASLSTGTVLLGLAAARAPLPVLEQVVSPEKPANLTRPEHPPGDVIGGRVMVVNTWRIAPEDRAPFLQILEDLRRVRLRTGAVRWRLYRNVEHPDRISELFMLPSWEEHLRQHDRLDVEAAEIIARARSFDVADGPVTRHLVAMDVTDEGVQADWELQAELHADMHRHDGSLPLKPSGVLQEPSG